MATFKGYQIKGIDIDKLPELTEELTEKPHYNIHLLLKPIEETADDSVEISPKPSAIWKESFSSILSNKHRALSNQVGHDQHIHISLHPRDDFYIYVQGFTIDSMAEHSQFFIDLVDAVNKQALSEIEEKMREKQKKKEANEEFRKRAERINAKCFPGTPTSE